MRVKIGYPRRASSPSFPPRVPKLRDLGIFYFPYFQLINSYYGGYNHLYSRSIRTKRGFYKHWRNRGSSTGIQRKYPAKMQTGQSFRRCLNMSVKEVTVHIHNLSRLACFSVNLPVIMDQQSKKDIHPVFNKKTLIRNR